MHHNETLRRRFIRRLASLMAVLAMTTGLSVAAAPAHASCVDRWSGLGAAGNVSVGGVYIGQVALEWNNCPGLYNYKVRAHFEYATTYVDDPRQIPFTVDAQPDLVAWNSDLRTHAADYWGPTSGPGTWNDLFGPSSCFGCSDYFDYGLAGSTYPQALYQGWVRIEVWGPAPGYPPVVCYAASDIWNFNSGTIPAGHHQDCNV